MNILFLPGLLCLGYSSFCVVLCICSCMLRFHTLWLFSVFLYVDLSSDCVATFRILSPCALSVVLFVAYSYSSSFSRASRLGWSLVVMLD